MTRIQTIAALLMVFGIACGAFGAHALRDVVPPGDLIIWEKGVFYHLIHALGILVISIFPDTALAERLKKRISILLVCSILIFSGTLYGIVLTSHRWLGMITPIGGLGFMLSWLLLAFGLRRSKL